MDDEGFEIEITGLNGEPISAPRRRLLRPAPQPQADDDSLAIEVTDLRAVSPLTSWPVPSDERDERDEHADTLTSGNGGAEPARRSLSPLAPRLRRRARLLGSAGAATVVAIALAAVLLGSPVARGALTPYFATPTATPEGANVVQLVNDAPWGKLLVDGHTIARSDFDGQFTFIHLDGGTHHLVFVAPPFPAVRCQLSVPGAAADSCPLAPDASGIQFGEQPLRVEGVRVLDLRSTVENLSPESRDQLVAAIRTLFAGDQQSAVVNPGEHYLAADQSVRVAPGMLTVTQSIALDADLNSGLEVNGSTCVLVCSLPAPAGLYGGWPILATATVIWQFIDANGALVDESLPQSLAGAPGAVAPIPLTATWDNTWQVSFPNETGVLAGPGGVPDAASNVEAQVLCNLAEYASSRENTPSTSYGSIGWDGTAPNPAEGCVTVNQATSPTQQLVGHAELLLYRFGVLLAASDVAHQLNPDLPVADAAELALAQQAASASEPPQFTGGGGG